MTQNIPGPEVIMSLEQLPAAIGKQLRACRKFRNCTKGSMAKVLGVQADDISYLEGGGLGVPLALIHKATLMLNFNLRLKFRVGEKVCMFRSGPDGLGMDLAEPGERVGDEKLQNLQLVDSVEGCGTADDNDGGGGVQIPHGGSTILGSNIQTPDDCA